MFGPVTPNKNAESNEVLGQTDPTLEISIPYQYAKHILNPGGLRGMLTSVQHLFVSYWNQWNQREKWLVGGGGAAILFYLLYLAVYLPLNGSIIQTRALVQENEETLIWLKRIKTQLQSLPASKTVSVSELMGIIGDEIKSSNRLSVFPYQLTQSSSGNIELKFDKVPFNHFLSWCHQLNQRYRFELKLLSAEQTEVAGVVRMSCVLMI